MGYLQAAELLLITVAIVAVFIDIIRVFNRRGLIYRSDYIVLGLITLLLTVVIYIYMSLFFLIK